jgi:hypothetical protein
MPPRTHPTVIRRFNVEPPSQGPAVDAFIHDPQAVLDHHPTVPSTAMARTPLEQAEPLPSMPTSIVEETQRAMHAHATGGRYAYRGERPIRVTFDLPKGLHKALRLRCVHEGLDSRAIMIRALAALGIVEK